ncbi:Protein odr-4 [Amphibalanus amphitrite]|uniref:Protein odr-4 n=1 Tax=Amphibalanus amphitrite TaxID=1232801 RepID=A0A6A4X7V0_AMPAM|nr:Protein odr-4 [Amphibalanus amphitrite]
MVIQLLPGGMDILGLFVVASPDLFKSHETQLRSALAAIYRALEKLPQLHDTDTDERLVALLDPRTKKVTCRSLELSSLTSSLRPAEWRFQEVRWHRAQSALSVQVTSGVGVLVAETSLLRQVMTKTPRSEQLLEPVEAVIRINGRIHCLAYLHTKATLEVDDVLDTVEVASEERAHSECSSAAEALDEIQEQLQQAGGGGIGCLHLLLAMAIVGVGILVSSLLLIGPRPPGAQ